MIDDPTTLSDHDLIAAYEATAGTPGDLVADAIVAEIKRRSLDV